jgi:hypothetical protein
MKFEIENKAATEIENFSTIERHLKLLKSYGPHSFASLTDSNGNYIQVGGGQYTCFVERFDASNKILYRANHEKSSTNFPNKTKLEFGGGSVILNSTEWFNINDVICLFLSFYLNNPYPSDIYWTEYKINN